MFKRKYFVTYKVNPRNKARAGTECVTRLTLGGKMENLNQQARALLTLARIHKVPPANIELGTYELISSEFMPFKWLKDKIVAFFSRDSQ